MPVLVVVGRNLSNVMDAPKLTKERTQTEHADYYFEDGFCVFKATFLARKGSCCGSGCRHCPYQPQHHRGTTKLNPEVLKNL